jgi:hypothetical protein
MSTKPKTTHRHAGAHAAHATAKAKEPKPIKAGDWAKQMMDSLTEAQKRWIDIASEQNALVMKAITEGVNFYKTAPTPALADWAKQGFESIVEAQKRWADIAAKESKQFDFNALTQALSDVTGQGIEAFVKARTQWLDFVAKQNALTLKTLKDNLGFDDNSSATALADFAEQAVTNYVEVQKRWLDLTTQLPFLRPVEKR